MGQRRAENGKNWPMGHLSRLVEGARVQISKICIKSNLLLFKKSVLEFLWVITFRATPSAPAGSKVPRRRKTGCPKAIRGHKSHFLASPSANWSVGQCVGQSLTESQFSTPVHPSATKLAVYPALFTITVFYHSYPTTIRLLV